MGPRGRARGPVGQDQAAAVLKTGYKIRSGGAEFVVAGERTDRHRSGGSLAELGRQAARHQLDALDRFHAHPRFEPARQRVSEIEAVQSVEDLLFGRAMQVQDAARIANHAGGDAQGRAQIVGIGIGRVDDIGVGDGLPNAGGFQVERVGCASYFDRLHQLARRA